MRTKGLPSFLLPHLSFHAPSTSLFTVTVSDHLGLVPGEGGDKRCYKVWYCTDTGRELMLVLFECCGCLKLVVSPYPYPYPEHFMASLENSPISEDFFLGVPLEGSNTSPFWFDA